MEGTCATCYYWINPVDDVGECRRFPMIANMTPDAGSPPIPVVHFPPTPRLDSLGQPNTCGEFVKVQVV